MTTMFVYQLEREILRKIITENGNFLTGKCLDIGAKEKRSRYAELLGTSEYFSNDLMGDVDIIGSAENLPVASDSFDSVLCTQVLYNVPHPYKVISEIHRILKTGGKVILSTSVVNEVIEDDYCHFTPLGLKTIFEEEGFEIVDSINIGNGLLTLIHQLLNRFLKRTLNLPESFLRRPFNKIFIYSGKACQMIDKLFNTGDRYALGVVILAIKK